MKLIARGTFRRDYRKVTDENLYHALAEKLEQIQKAKNISQITGLKLLEGYSYHFRIKSQNRKTIVSHRCNYQR